MSKEILHKAISIEPGEGWVYGLLHIEATYPYSLDIPVFRQAIQKKLYNSDDEYESVAIAPETICDYIGFTDYKGQKIFENDVIEGTFSDGTKAYHLIQYDVNSASFVAVYQHSTKYLVQSGGISKKWVDEFKKIVVGNIFDNPELTAQYMGV